MARVAYVWHYEVTDALLEYQHSNDLISGHMPAGWTVWKQLTADCKYLLTNKEARQWAYSERGCDWKVLCEPALLLQRRGSGKTRVNKKPNQILDFLICKQLAHVCFPWAYFDNYYSFFYLWIVSNNPIINNCIFSTRRAAFHLTHVVGRWLGKLLIRVCG